MDSLTGLEVMLILVAFSACIMTLGFILMIPFMIFEQLFQPTALAKGAWAWVSGGFCIFAGILLVSVTAVAPGFVLTKMLSANVLYVGGTGLTLLGAWLVWNYARESLEYYLANPFDL